MQAVVAVVLGGLVIFALHRHRDARILAIGATVLLLALMGVRAIH